MRRADREIKSILQSNAVEMHDDTVKKINLVLDNLPEKEIMTSKRHTNRFIWKVAVAIAAVLFVLPNMNPAIAMAMGELPYVGKIFQVITVREYQYEDEKHVAEIATPQIIADEENLEENADGIAVINRDSKQLTDQIISEFEASLEENQYQATYVDYEVVSDTDEWFTLKMLISEVSASGTEYYKYYNIDRATGKSVQLNDLFASEKYVKAISDNIYEQMKEQMEKCTDDSIFYWIADDGEDAENYIINKDQNFYYNTNGELVIVYDEYDVAPGYMGCPEFTIPDEVYEEYLK